jgi:hypothetical protein
MYVAMHFAAAAQVLLRLKSAFSLQPSAFSFPIGATNNAGIAKQEANS